MSLIDNIGIAIISCGLCKNNTLCLKCRVETMKANGLPVELASELEGLKTGWSNSEVYWKLVKLEKVAKANAQSTDNKV